MIISHKHKFIFVQPAKTGGSSVKRALCEADVFGNDDIFSVPPVDLKVPSTKSDILFTGKYENIKRNSMGQLYLGDGTKHRLSSMYEHSVGFVDFTHLTPAGLVEIGLISEDILQDYVIVTTLRDPVDKFISSWFYTQVRDKKDISLQILCNHINNISSKQGCKVCNYPIREYYIYKGEYLPKIKLLKTDTLFKDVAKFIKEIKGKSPKKEYKLKAGFEPDWAIGSSKTWMPNDELNKLKSFLRDEIQFYNTIGV
jgi:hypothetical protein